MDSITEILRSYAIFPQTATPITDRLYKIKADGKEYALKQSRLDKTSVKQWVLAYRTASEKNLHDIVPVYLTQNQNLYVERADGIYYLMPWVSAGTNRKQPDEERIRSIYERLGKLHVRTKSMYSLDKEKLMESFEVYKKTCKQDETRLLHWIEQLEKIHYPSPFELQVLTYYRDIRHGLSESQLLADRILSLGESEHSWGVSLCHNYLEPEHLLEYYMLNWERASYKHAVYDLTDLLHAAAVKEPHYREEFIQYFSVYLEEHPLNELEQRLLALYLMNGNECIGLISSYFQQAPQKPVVERSIQLAQARRKLIVGIQLNQQLEKWRRKEPD